MHSAVVVATAAVTQCVTSQPIDPSVWQPTVLAILALISAAVGTVAVRQHKNGNGKV